MTPYSMTRGQLHTDTNAANKVAANVTRCDTTITRNGYNESVCLCLPPSERLCPFVAV